MATVWAVVLAAGTGTRFGSPKQYELLGDRRVLDWAVAAARTVAEGVVLVVAPDRAGEAATHANTAAARINPTPIVFFMAGLRAIGRRSLPGRHLRDPQMVGVEQLQNYTPI